MIKLYTHLHHANNSLKKHRLAAGLLLFLIFLASSYTKAQCIPAPVVNAVANQGICNNTATTVINFTGTATSYTWTNSSPAIGLAASGSGNISSFTALNATATAVVATVTVTPVAGVCTGTPISFTITVNPSPPVTVTPVSSCGGNPGGSGPCNPVTASGADTYVWSPITGLYTDCSMAVPYPGGNVATVYAAPLTVVTYTVTGASAATGCYKAATAFVNTAPPAPVVLPPSVFMCISDPPVKLKTGADKYCSGPVNIAVPDNNVTGASSNILIAGIPAGCTVNGISVTINMAHTRISDMIFVLKAPNGQIINLDYRLSATGSNGTSTGFNNTIISSAGTLNLSAGTNPYTNTFKADAAVAATGGLGVPGPTGMLPTVSSFTNLFISPNGAWTLGFYDAATGETGILNSWCLSLTYSCGFPGGTPTTIWSPLAGLFYDANGTTPYTGLPADSVWVKPTSAGVYTYQVTSQSRPWLFYNMTAINIPVGGAATAYPANINVAGLPVSGVSVKSVTLQGFSHTKSKDVAVILQSPMGQNLLLMADVGGSNAVNNTTYTFVDGYPAMSSVNANPTGIYKPTSNAAAHSFPTPGPGVIVQPSPSIATLVGNFNGPWKLFVIDEDGTSDQGSIAGGFAINFNIAPACTSPANTVVVTVGVPTIITTQPADQKVCLGNDAQFTVVAPGSGLSYQWQVSTNGGATFTNLINAGPYNGVNTATLTITAPPLSMSGYRFKVNINGSATCGASSSSSALLTVNTLPLVSFYPHPYTKLLPGLVTTLSAVVSPTAAATYTWLHEGSVVPGATADTLLVDFNQIGLYQLRVTDVNGCTNVSDTMSIRDSALGKMFIFPNPSSGKFQVRLYNEPNKVSARTLTVYDNRGNRVITRSYTQTNSYQRVDIDVRKYGKGIYWVEVTDVNGKRLGLSKMLIQ